MRDMYKAQPVLKKNDVLNLMAKFLMDNRGTSIDSLRSVVERELKDNGSIGEITERSGMMSTTFTRRIADSDAMLINECIYDLLYSRVITPGVDGSNLNLPFVHVSDEDKLSSYL